MKKLCILFAWIATTGIASAQPVELTFRVDMQHETVSSHGVHVAGDFQTVAGFGGNWNPAVTPMEDNDGDGIYDLTVSLPQGTYLYKFINGNSWQDKPELPDESCALNDGGGNYNRQVVVGASGIDLPAVQFDSCNAVLRLSVNMRGLEVSEQGVHVMGDFQKKAGLSDDWDPASIAMTDLNRDGTYDVTMNIPAGTYHYVFINGNTADHAEMPPPNCSIEFNGSQIREKIAAVDPSTSDRTYCFNTCEDCDPSISTDYDTRWWNDAVFYELFVRSFYDSDGDGIGDFRGIIEKLDYLNDGDPETTDDLGITGIWLMPMMSSPSYHGYDIIDYYTPEPDYGTMEDFEALIEAAHARGIKVIIDFVMNHVSNQNPWFTQSVASQGDYRNWFIWSNTNPGFTGPWGQQVWHNRNGYYYYGLFWSGMPDLDYSYPPVKEAMFDIAGFWLDKGVDGFRLDAIKYLDEDGLVLEGTPETFAILEEFRVLYKSKNTEAITVGEVWDPTSEIIPYIREDRLDLCFEFGLAFAIVNGVNSDDPSGVQLQLDVIQASYPKLQYATFLTNHDIARVFTTLQGSLSKMKQAAALYLTLPGVPFIYYGEEVGMQGTGSDENFRRPMQWTGGQYAGFSTISPWLSVGGNYHTNNVDVMQTDDASLLNHYRSLVQLRNLFAPLRRGYLLELTTTEEKLVAYSRVYENEAAIIISNFDQIPKAGVLTQAISSLPEGQYHVTEELSRMDLGMISINTAGGFEGWQPSTVLINPRETWVLSLKPSGATSVNARVHDAPDIVLSPNPCVDKLHVRYRGEHTDVLNVEVYDLQGKLILSRRSPGQDLELDVSGLLAGSYFIKVSDGDSQRVLQFVKNGL